MVICERCLVGTMKHDAHNKPIWLVCPVCSWHLSIEEAEEKDSPIYSGGLSCPRSCHEPLRE